MAATPTASKDIFRLADPFRYGGYYTSSFDNHEQERHHRCAARDIDKLWAFVETNPATVNAGFEPTYFIDSYIDMYLCCLSDRTCPPRYRCVDSAMRPLIAVCQWEYVEYNTPLSYIPNNVKQTFSPEMMLKTVQLLVQNGANASYSYYGAQPVHIIASKPGLFAGGLLAGARIVDLLAANGGDINARVEKTENCPEWQRSYMDNVEKSPPPFSGWTRQKHMQERSWLGIALSKVDNEPYVDYVGLTPFLIAVLSKPNPEDPISSSVRILQDLATRGADVNATDKNGNNALHLAVMTRKLDTVPFLLSRGVPQGAANSNGLSPLELLQAQKPKEGDALKAKVAARLLQAPPSDIEGRGGDKLDDFIE